MAVNLASKYSSKLDLIIKHGSYTDNDVNKDYDFDGVNTIHVLTPTTVPLSDYDRTSSGDRYGGNSELQDTKGTYILQNDKSFKIAIDRGNFEQQMQAKQAGAVLRAQMDEQVTPAIDKNRFAKAVAGAVAVNQIVEYGTTKAYDKVLDLGVFLGEHEMPENGRVLYITTKMYKLVKSEIVLTAHTDAYGNKLVEKGYVGMLDSTPVKVVPSAYFPEGVHAIMWHKKTLLGANQVTSIRKITDSENVDGVVLAGRFIYDAFVLDAKKYGVAIIAEKSKLSSSSDTSSSSTTGGSDDTKESGQTE